MSPSLSLDGASKTIFVGGPFSSALRFDSSGAIVGFDETLRQKLQGVYDWLKREGFGVLSSHVAESFGAAVHEATLVQRDNTWLRVCDAYLGVLPFDTSSAEPYRTDGTFVEIGMAIALGRPCVLLVERPDDSAWSYYVRNLSAEPHVWVVDAQSAKEVWLDVLSQALALEGSGQPVRIHVAEADVLRSLVCGASLGHVNMVRGLPVHVPAEVFSTRYDSALRWAVERLSARPEQGARRVAVIAADAGELLAASLDGTTETYQYALTTESLSAVSMNISGLGLANALVLASLDGRFDHADELYVHFPPTSRDGVIFGDQISAALAAVSSIGGRLKEGTEVFILVGNDLTLERVEPPLRSSLPALRVLDEAVEGGHILTWKA